MPLSDEEFNTGFIRFLENGMIFIRQGLEINERGILAMALNQFVQWVVSQNEPFNTELIKLEACLKLIDSQPSLAAAIGSAIKLRDWSNLRYNGTI